MKLKELGFFKELAYGNNESIHNHMQNECNELTDKIVKYLQRGIVCASAFGLVKDVISGEILGPQMMLTDGHWVWGNDLSHYVDKYNVRLPAEFIGKVQSWDGSDFEVDLSQVEL